MVQRALLNKTGPLCSLHDTLSSGTQVPAEEIKCIVEQTLCLLGSGNHQLSLLLRKQVFANINKGKINLADQPLPNAKVFCLERTSPLSLPSRRNFLVAWLRNYLIPQNPKPPFSEIGDHEGQATRTTGNFTKYPTNPP